MPFSGWGSGDISESSGWCRLPPAPPPLLLSLSQAGASWHPACVTRSTLSQQRCLNIKSGQPVFGKEQRFLDLFCFSPKIWPDLPRNVFCVHHFLSDQICLPDSSTIWRPSIRESQVSESRKATSCLNIDVCPSPHETPQSSEALALGFAIVPST